MTTSKRQSFIQYSGVHPAIDFAAHELQKYLGLMDPGVDFILLPHLSDRHTPAFRLGLFTDFNLPVPSQADSRMDDHIHIAISAGQGIIAGLNPRAVLLAVYRFLEEAGCRFIRPGKDGEFIPNIDSRGVSVALDSAPAYRYRGLCIEGAVSLEHMLDNVDWAPKAGFNSYFLEFMLPYTFFERWYRHDLNPLLAPEPLSEEQVRGFMDTIEKEIVRRGLAYHNPGHGWTCESLGISGPGWFPTYPEITPEKRRLMAEVDGKRELFKGVALNTHLCYSNPEARRAVVEYAVQYVKSKPYIDFLHVWLADSINNLCECENCRDIRPADHYVRLLNEIEAALTAAGLQTRIVFIAYLDLMWPPVQQKFNHPERFALLFAPISRSYSKPYDTNLAGITIPEYQLNQIRLPSDIRENLAFLRDWQKVFSGDGFTYEYYFMWDCYLDPGYYEAAKVLHEDIRRLRLVGLNGIMSDQTQRSFFPTAFGMHVMARSLWDDKRSFDEIAGWYFNSDFGEDGPAVRAYLETLSQLFDPTYLRGERQPKRETGHTWVIHSTSDAEDEAAERNLAQIPGIIDAFRPTIKKNLAAPQACRARSWQILDYHADLALLLARAFEERARGDTDQASLWWEKAREFACRSEQDLHPVLDVFELISVLGSRFRKPAQES